MPSVQEKGPCQPELHAPAHATIHALCCAFMQQIPPLEIVALLLDMGGGRMSPAAQAALLQTCLRHPLSSLFPISSQHKRRLLRAVMLAAERDGCELNEELVEQYTACLLGSRLGASEIGVEAEEQQDGCSLGRHGLQHIQQAHPGWAFKVWFYSPVPWHGSGSRAAGPDARTLQRLGEWEQASLVAQHASGDVRHGLLALHVSNNLLEGGTGCHEWEAGFFLAEFVLSHPQLFAGSTCLELGCGAGMVGVALQRAGAARVVCTDGDPQTVGNCRFNLQLNGVELVPETSEPATARPTIGCAPAGTHVERTAAVECRTLRWEDGAGYEAPDIVLGADLLYDPEAISSLLALLKQLLAAGGSHGAGAMCEGDKTSTSATGCNKSSSSPAAFIATTRRNEATLQAFLEAVAADHALDLTDVTAMQHGAAQHAPVQEGTYVSGDLKGAAWDDGERLEAEHGCVQFHHHSVLDAARSRILLHRLQLVPDAMQSL